MPELPDVEIFRRRIEENALRRVVETVRVSSDDLLVDTSESSLRDALRGHTLRETLRHGKHLFVRSGEERRRWLRLHFGMTGSVEIYQRDDEPQPEHTHLALDLEGGRTLAYRCPRKFGEIGLVDEPAVFVEASGLGPDPWGGGVAGAFDLSDFREVLEGRRGMLKPTLMNQDVLAGLGNVYVDEALFQAELHPETRVDDLDSDAVARLWESTKVVMETAVERDADPERLPEDWLLPRREKGPCPRCDGSIVKSEVGGRATYRCDSHQRRD